jgi:hypothetical protein
MFYKLASYLDVRSITRVLRASTRLNRLEKGQAIQSASGTAIFWHTVYMLRPPYKNPGFKLDKVDWRILLLKKD